MTRKAPEGRPEHTEYIRRLVDSAPALTTEQADKIASLLRPAPRKA